MWRLVFVVLASFLTTSLACTCIPPHPQQHFCDSDYVLRITPLSATAVDTTPANPNPNPFTQSGVFNIRYTVQVEQVFKGAGVGPGSIIYVYTASSSATCGMRLMNSPYDRRSWLIMGNFRQRRLRINACGFNREWNTLSSQQITGLQGYYRFFCGACRICNENFCENQGPGTCSYPMGQSQCYNHAYCLPRSGRCTWSDCISRFPANVIGAGK